MKYDERPDINRAYELIAVLYVVEDKPEEAMTVSAALVALGEHRSWASVWWAYGAIHYDLSDESYTRALHLLDAVDTSDSARAAALMLIAEIESTQAIEHEEAVDFERQVELLKQVVRLASRWPSARLRLAEALQLAGDLPAARQQAREALTFLEQNRMTDDPFESAISGEALDRRYVTRVLAEIIES